MFNFSAENTRATTDYKSKDSDDVCNLWRLTDDKEQNGVQILPVASEPNDQKEYHMKR